jgi:hypothetical protein
LRGGGGGGAGGCGAVARDASVLGVALPPAPFVTAGFAAAAALATGFADPDAFAALRFCPALAWRVFAGFAFLREEEDVLFCLVCLAMQSLFGSVQSASARCAAA